MTVEELEIIVDASVEKALKEFEKLVPAIKQATKQMTEQLNKTNLSGFTGKIQQAVRQVKQRIESLKNSNKSNEIAIKVSTEDAQKQVTQLQKQIDSLQKKIQARQLKLDAINPQIDAMVDNTRKQVTPQGINPNSSAMDKTVNNALAKNKDFTLLNSQAQKLYTEIEMYNQQLNEAKNRMSQLKQEVNQTATTQNKLGSFFNAFKNKIEQTKLATTGMKSKFSGIPKITQNITNNIKNMGNGLKQGLGHVLKYAGALLSLRGIYSILSNSASAWLSSQNAGAQQLSANIEYMKYAMGSALAPVIQYVTNLVYQLMKAIQSVAYALTGVNIFAKATASSMKSAAGSAKKAKEETQQLAGVHDEINNIQDNNSDSGSAGSGSASPSFDLSQMDNTPNSIIDAIKNGDWYLVGATIGEKLNEAMEKIPWDKIQNTARKIGTNIAQFLNGFIATTDWNQVGNTIAQGLNTAIYFGYSFITTFDWKKLGKAIGNTINGFFKNIDWATAGKTVGDGIKGVFDTITATFTTIEWAQIGIKVKEFIFNVDWTGMTSSICSALGAGLGGISAAIASFLNEAIVFPLADFLTEKIEEAGGDIVLGLLKGIVDGFVGIGEWIYDNMIYPFVTSFCEALGIHSPSTLFFKFGKNIVQGLLNGIKALVDKVTKIWDKIKSKAIEIFTNVKDKVSEVWNNIKTDAQEKWDNIKENVTNKWNDIKTSASEKFSNIKENIANCWNTTKSNTQTTWENIKSTIVSKASEAKTNAVSKITEIKDNVINKFNDIKSNTSNSWSNIKNTITSKVTDIKSHISTWSSNVKSTWSSHWNEMNSKAGGKLTEIKNGVSSKLSNAKTTIQSWASNTMGTWRNHWNNMNSNVNFNNAKNAINSFKSDATSKLSSLGSSASTWGKDLVSNLASGIRNNISKVTSAASSLANQIKSFLHFSEPDVGPLSDFHTYMPDMINLMVKGIHGNMGKLTNELENLTGMISYTINTPDIPLLSTNTSGIGTIQPQNIMKETFENVLSRQGNNGQPIHITVNYLGKDIFDDVIDEINDRTIRTNKNTIITVGD